MESGIVKSKGIIKVSFFTFFLFSWLLLSSCSKNENNLDSKYCSDFKSEIKATTNSISENKSTLNISNFLIKLKFFSSTAYPNIKNIELKESFRYISEIEFQSNDEQNRAQLANALTKAQSIFEICKMIK